MIGHGLHGLDTDITDKSVSHPCNPWPIKKKLLILFTHPHFRAFTFENT
jgi:hypothetical protein